MNERNIETTNDDTVIETSNNQLTIRRTFDAPRERVWRAFTDPDELEQWFVPEGMTADVRANELEAGGEMSIRWTDGETTIDNEGYYVEVDENERLVTGEEIEDGELTVSYEFRDVDGGTEVVITQEFPNSVPDGAAEGWTSMLDGLDELLDERSTDVETGATSLTIRRTVDAPRERVFEAFTEHQAMAEWYGGDLMDVEIHELEAEPDGSFSITMRDDDAYDIEGEFLEVVENERIVHTWYVGQITVDLADVAGGTEIVFTHDGLPDRATTDMHAEGWVDAVDALATMLAVETGGSEQRPTRLTEAAEFDPSEYDTTITRTFDAPRERVWAAWIDPAQVAQWWGPEEFTVPSCDLDVRPGGTFHVDMEAPDGTIYPDAGEILEVDEPARLVLVHRAFVDENGTAQLETRSTVTFEADGDRTHLTLEAEVLTATPEVAVHLEGMELGWTGSFEKLDAHVAETAGGSA